MSIFILEVIEDGEKYQYEYGCYAHAKEQLDREKQGYIYEYKQGNYYFVEGKS